MPFEWTPGFWQGWRESSNPYRQFKSARDRTLTVQALQLHDAERILEVGCGYGWITEALLQTAKIRWVGLDRSESMIRRLRASLAHSDRAAFVGDACRLPFCSHSFDKVLCTGVLMHVRDEYRALQEMTRVLRPGGLLVCSMNNSLSPFSWPVRLRNSFRKGFVQNFRLPGTYRRYLKRLGLRLERIRGDALFTGVSINVGRGSFPPKSAFSFLRSLDEWLVERMPWLAYEVWFAAVKVGAACESKSVA